MLLTNFYYKYYKIIFNNMNKKFNENLFIKELSKSITDIIYESIGTLQLNNDESKLINQIYDDINNKDIIS